jgi:NAD(P)-dependent dehydrogenase (short-subunit alcohol dehydrogenase family)
MKLSGAVVLVTGANRGIGAEFVRQLRDRGAATVYAGARDPGAVTAAAGVQPLALDVTDPQQIAAAAARAADVQLVVNNAGIALGQPLIGADPALVRREFETNVFAPLAVIDAFAPVLAANGGGTILNVLSAVSWLSFPGFASYSATKAAFWSLTDGLRLELAGQGTHVLGLHMGPVDTALGEQFPLAKVSPAQVVAAALDGVEAGADEVLADDLTKAVKATLTAEPSRYAALLG